MRSSELIKDLTAYCTPSLALPEGKDILRTAVGEPLFRSLDLSGAPQNIARRSVLTLLHDRGPKGRAALVCWVEEIHNETFDGAPKAARLTAEIRQYAPETAQPGLGSDMAIDIDVIQQAAAGQTLRPWQKGSLIDERWRLSRWIKRGGFGEVWTAYDLKDRCQVAVKELRIDVASERSLVKRFFQGARVMDETVSYTI